MKLIIHKSSFSDILLSNQEYFPDKKYRFLKYVLKIPVAHGILIENFLTSQLIFLNEDEYYNDCITDNEIIKFLIENWYLVPEDNNDKELCFLLNSFRRALQSDKKMINHYTILSTTDCNARCFYCYEHGIAKKNMNKEIAINVAKFIVENSHGNSVTIQWFGGEPLYNIEPIDLITNYLKANDISFSSRIITNGYLFDSKVIEKAISLWNVNTVQITLDGTEKIYNKYKAYIYHNDPNPFIRVINNIKTLINNNICVYLRINLDIHNQSNVYELAEYIYNKIGPSRFLHVYTYPLYENHKLINISRDIEEKEKIYRKLYDFECFLYRSKLKIINPINNKLKNNVCIADHNNAVVILPDGKITKCDHMLESAFIGDIYNGIQFESDFITYWKIQNDPEDKCYECPIYPVCLKLKNCPDRSRLPCVASERKYKIEQKKWSIIEAYNRFIKDTADV